MDPGTLSSLLRVLHILAAMLGTQIAFKFPYWLTGVLIVLIALWTWRFYSSTTKYGWV